MQEMDLHPWWIVRANLQYSLERVDFRYPCKPCYWKISRISQWGPVGPWLSGGVKLEGCLVEAEICCTEDNRDRHGAGGEGEHMSAEVFWGS